MSLYYMQKKKISKIETHDGIDKSYTAVMGLPSTPRSLFVGTSPSSTPSGSGLKALGMSRHFLTGA